MVRVSIGGIHPLMFAARNALMTGGRLPPVSAYSGLTTGLPALNYYDVEVNNSGDTAYVACESQVAFVDVATNAVTSTPITVTNGLAQFVSLSPDGLFLWIAGKTASQTYILKYSFATGTVVNQVGLGQNSQLNEFFLNADGSKAFFCTTGGMYMMNLSTWAVTAYGSLSAYGAALSLDETKLYVYNYTDYYIYSVDLSTNVATKTSANIGWPFHDLAVSPNGSELYVVNGGTTMSRYSTSDFAGAGTFTWPVRPGYSLTALSILKDPVRPNIYYAGGGAGGLSAIDVSTGTGTYLEVSGAYPDRVAISRNGLTLYATNSSTDKIMKFV